MVQFAVSLNLYPVVMSVVIPIDLFVWKPPQVSVWIDQDNIQETHSFSVSSLRILTVTDIEPKESTLLARILSSKLEGMKYNSLVNTERTDMCSLGNRVIVYKSESSSKIHGLDEPHHLSRKSTFMWFI